jgi:DNA-binding response OmpR family regulator
MPARGTQSTSAFPRSPSASKRASLGLVTLAEHPERGFETEKLLGKRLGLSRRVLGRTRTLDSDAGRLRRKLNRPGGTAYVLNVWGFGYRLVGASV